MAVVEETNTLLDLDALAQSLTMSPMSLLSWSLTSDNALTCVNAPEAGDFLLEHALLENTCVEQSLVTSAQPCTGKADFTNPDVSPSPSSAASDYSGCATTATAATEGEEQTISSSSGSSCSHDEATMPERREQKRKPRQARQTKSRKGLSTSSSNKLPPCRVCADPASGFHYGVNSCEACKRFFRRALRRKRNFKCRGNKNCTIKGKKQSLCGYCRYERCLAVGMSKINIKTGRYTHEKRAQNILEIQRIGTNSKLTPPEAEVNQIVQKMVSAHARVISNLNIPLEEMYNRAMELHEEFLLKKEMFGIQAVLSPDQYDEIYRSTGLDVDERRRHMDETAKSIDLFVKSYVCFGKSVPGFSDLPLNDQADLLKLARVEVWFLCAYRGFFKDLEVFYPPSRNCKTRHEMEKLLGPDYVTCAFNLAAALQRLHLTNEEVIVLQGVCLTFSDRCELEDGPAVDAVQWRMLGCLLYLLRKNHNDETLFHKVMSWTVAVRNLTELSQKALQNTHFSDAIRSNSDLGDMILVKS